MPRARQLLSACLLLAGIGAALAITLSGCGTSAGGSRARTSTVASAGVRDPGVPISGVARDFTLTDQFGRPVSLHSFRGKVVILAFNDPVCTTICPLTTTAMVQAKQLLGAAGSKVQLLGVAANPTATQVKWVRAYSRAHQMTHSWHFLTGSLPQLKKVWHAYGIEARIVAGQIDHTPAVYVIGPDGRLSRLYMTLMAYTSVSNQAEMLAQSAASLLPGHPQVRLPATAQNAPSVGPGTAVTLPRAGGGTLRLGPGGSPHLLLFFDTWLSEMTHLGSKLDALNSYQSEATASGLPSLTAIDEASVEPSSSALGRFLHGLAQPLSYPIALDRTGQVADGYRVQDEPWLALVSGSGKFLWYSDPNVAGWPSTSSLIGHVRAALARGSSSSQASAAASATGALASLDSQAGQLLGSESALTSRLQVLRGHPVVINAWASWCQPCRAEFPLFASASKRWGTSIAFVGADTNDSTGSARTFLQQHPIGYPSYQTSTTGLSSLVSIEGLPTTIFIGPAGKVIDVHTGQYSSQAALNHDISAYALHR